MSGWISSHEFIWVNLLGQMQARRQKASKSTIRFSLRGYGLRKNNQNAMMAIILFGEHSIIGDYAKAIKADDDSVDISFGATTIRYKYKSPQAWLNNNWESYLIIQFRSPK